MLTQKQIDNAKPQSKEYRLYDVKRLYLRVRPDADKTWGFDYQWKGELIKMVINGNSLAEIRAQASRFNEWLDIGIKGENGLPVKTSPKHKLEADEFDAKLKAEAETLRLERERQAEISKQTVNQLFDRWLRLGLLDRKDTKEIKRMFEKDVLPAIGHLHVIAIHKSHIVEIINELQTRGVTRMAKLMLSLMRQMFRFAVDQSIIEYDPTASLRKAKIGGRDIVRDRVLSEAEIKQLNSQIQQSGLSPHSKAAVWLMLSTGCRVGELMQSEWRHLNLYSGIWTIPAENSKNGKAHTVYLSKFAQNQFQQLSNIQLSEKWIFPNRKDTNHVCPKTLAKQVGDRQMALQERKPMSGRSKQTEALILEGGKWTPHDLRRTAATTMGGLNVRPDVIEKCLNHIEQNKIVRTYQHQTLVPEQKEAWRLLGERLELITSDNANNVITLKHA
mgnify:CR=1 FL=1